MATPIDQIGLHELAPTLKTVAKAGGTTHHTDWMRVCDASGNPVNAALMLRFIEEQMALAEQNLYQLAPEVMLAALRRANKEEKDWNLTEADFVRLANTIPELPKGKLTFLSFRIRFGEGDEGVALTFERHANRIKRVFGEKGYWRWDLLLSGSADYNDEPVERLRLFAGNETHHACVEWTIIDLDTNRERESITAVRGPQSLADELLVATWLFPDLIRDIDYKKVPGMYAGGYEVNVPEYGGEPWQDVVIVRFARDDRQVDLFAGLRGNAYSGYSVPVRRERKALGA